MSRLKAHTRQVAVLFVRYRLQLQLTVRVTVAAMLGLVVAQALDVQQPYWAVFAAVMITETSVGGTVTAAINWMIGTVGGAAYGAAVAAYLPPSKQGTAVIELAVSIAPLVLLAALFPRLRVAPVTAIIVLATINNADMTPLASAIERVVEIGIGSVVGLAVSLLVLPSRASTLVGESSARALDQMARLLMVFRASFGRPLKLDDVQPIHFEIFSALGRLENMVHEAERERATRLTSGPDPAPLPRTLHRLRNDLVMIGRAVPEPFDEPLGIRLQPVFNETASELVRFLHAAAISLRKRRASPALAALDAAFDHFNIVLSEMRAEKLTRDLSAEMAGRIYALSFAFQQLRANLKDLAGRISERAV
jgi:uncharacterized membrane protein YccC